MLFLVALLTDIYILHTHTYLFVPTSTSKPCCVRYTAAHELRVRRG